MSQCYSGKEQVRVRSLRSRISVLNMGDVRSDVGKVSLGRTDYYLARVSKGLVFDVTFDARDPSYLLRTPDGKVTSRIRALGLEPAHILDIEPSQQRRLRNAEKG